MLKDLEIRGANTDEQRAARRAETRLLAFPDGVTRCITMQGRYWQALDWMVEQGAPLSGYLESTLSLAKKRPELLERAIRAEMPAFISVAYEDWQLEEHGPANANLWESVPPERVKDSSGSLPLLRWEFKDAADPSGFSPGFRFSDYER